MHTAEHALKPTVLLGAEELALLAARTADVAATPSAIARLRHVAAAVMRAALLRAALRLARGRARARR